MLHVRIASQPEMTTSLLEILAADSGVLNLVVLKGAVRQPDGDAVQFDLQMGSANRVFRQLREPGLADLRSVTVETVGASLTAPQAGAAPPRSGLPPGTPALVNWPRCGRWWRRGSRQAGCTRRASSSCW